MSRRPAPEPGEMMAASGFRVGIDLRAARERLGWDLAAVASGLRIRQAYLVAIEEGRLEDLPGNAYAMGFLRTYAGCLGLDPDEVSRRFRAEAADVNRKPELTFPAPVPQRGVPAGAMALVGVVLAVGAYVAWYNVSATDRQAARVVPEVPARLAALPGVGGQAATPPSPQVASVLPSHVTPAPAAAAAAAAAPASGRSVPAAVSAPVPAPPPLPDVSPTQAAAATPPPAPAAAAPAPASAPAQAPAPPTATQAAASAASPAPDGSHVVLLRATADAWVQVRQKDGRVLLNRLLRPGETWPVPSDAPQLLLTTGNAGGTELVVDGVAMAPLGSSGAVRRDLPLDSALTGAGVPAGAAPAPNSTGPVPAR